MEKRPGLLLDKKVYLNKTRLISYNASCFFFRNALVVFFTSRKTCEFLDLVSIIFVGKKDFFVFLVPLLSSCHHYLLLSMTYPTCSKTLLK